MLGDTLTPSFIGILFKQIQNHSYFSKLHLLFYCGGGYSTCTELQQGKPHTVCLWTNRIASRIYKVFQKYTS